jgi:nicotinamidase-related amidase
MAKEGGLRFGPIGGASVHLSVDMQRLFAEDTEWKTPWMARVLPKIVEIARSHASRTIFTRFVPAQHPGEGTGTWRRYYERWASMTIERIGEDMVDLVPELARFVPPAAVFDKRTYSPWYETDLHAHLQRRSIDTLVITGGETDVCVLTTVLGAVDRGYRVVIATDALCSSSDEAHEASLTVYENRYGQQVEAVATHVILDSWP